MSWNNFDNSMQNAGGFIDSSMAEGAGGDEKGGPKRGQNCMPVMIGHLQRHGEKLTVWGTPARIITIVGIVRKIESLSTKVTFELVDETGSIKAIKWLEGDNATFESPVTIGSYARVYGLIRDQGEECFVLIVNVQPLEHANELLTHLMEVTLMCLQSEHGGSSKIKSEAAQFNGTFNSTAANGSTAGPGGLNHQQQLVLDIIQNSDPEYGAERDFIKQKVPPNLVSKVDEIIEFLSGEGHIYTTKTDDFFKAI